VADIERTIADGRQGHMPPWGKRLSADDTRALAAYVYHLAHQELRD
jgi:cytochrome c oxidase cbb3-type subunit 3